MKHSIDENEIINPVNIVFGTPDKALGFSYEGTLGGGENLNDYASYYDTTAPITLKGQAFSVPVGMSGAITEISIVELIPGSFCSSQVSLLINGALSPDFPVAGHNVGRLSSPMRTNIQFKQLSTVEWLLTTSWVQYIEWRVVDSNIVVYDANSPAFAYLIRGYFIPAPLEVLW